MKWELHKPRVHRLRLDRVRATVSPSLVRREWLWTVERSNATGLSELAHGRCKRRYQAMNIAAQVAMLYDFDEKDMNRRRYHG